MAVDAEKRRRRQNAFYKRPDQRARRARVSAAYRKRRRLSILERDEFRCHYCCQVFASEDLTIDHRHPTSAGGMDIEENRVTCCLACNQEKGTMSYEIFKAIKHPECVPDWAMDMTIEEGQDAVN